MNLHPLARTTPRIRAEIKESTLSANKIAKQYNISKKTAVKWKNREETQDKSHRPHNFKTTMTPLEEAVTVELRRTLLLSLDDLLAIVREFMNPNVSRSGLHRCLIRNEVGNLNDLIPKEENSTKPIKTFKDYEPGLHPYRHKILT